MKNVRMNTAIVTAALALAIPQLSWGTGNRDYISIVGSSTVYPFSTVVAEHFGKTTGFKTPKVESTGSSGGFKLFCEGIGNQHPDITNSSRRIKQSEIDTCRNNGVSEIVEVKVGYDGIVLANSKGATALALTRKEIFLALAKEVPNPDTTQEMIPNPYMTWQDINPALPAIRIEVMGPPPTSGTRDAFVELAMEAGAKQFDWIKVLSKSDKNRFKIIAHTLREDGAYIEAGENDNLIVQKLVVNPKAVGIFGYSFLDQNSGQIQGALINGQAPTFDNIANGSYPVSRPLYLYVKKAHANMVPGINEYLGEFASEQAWGPEGYLADKGMIPMPKEERAQFSDTVRKLSPLTSL